MTATPPPWRCKACVEFDAKPPLYHNDANWQDLHHDLLAAEKAMVKDLSRTCVEWDESYSQLETRAEAAEASLAEAVRIFKNPETVLLHSYGFPNLAHQIDAFLLRQDQGSSEDHPRELVG